MTAQTIKLNAMVLNVIFIKVQLPTDLEIYTLNAKKNTGKILWMKMLFKILMPYKISDFLICMVKEQFNRLKWH